MSRIMRQSCLALVVAILVSSFDCQQRSRRPTKTIGITQIASHPSLDAVRGGIIEGLAQRGWRDGGNLRIVFKNANRDPALALPIAQAFVAESVDVIVPITTPSALAAAKSTTHIPIVFGGVTDPIGIGLVSDLNHPGKNITGTSDRWPFEQQIQMFRQIFPKATRIGMLFSPSDQVSEIAIREMSRICPKYGLDMITAPVSSSQDVFSAARHLLLRTQALYTGLDTLVVENLDSVLKAANEAKKPVLAGDIGSVERGALASYSIDMKELGLRTASLIDRVLRGENPGNIPVLVVSEGSPVLNVDAISTLRIKIPDEVAAHSQMIKTSKL